MHSATSIFFMSSLLGLVIFAGGLSIQHPIITLFGFISMLFTLLVVIGVHIPILLQQKSKGNYEKFIYRIHAVFRFINKTHLFPQFLDKITSKDLGDSTTASQSKTQATEQSDAGPYERHKDMYDENRQEKWKHQSSSRPVSSETVKEQQARKVLELPQQFSQSELKDSYHEKAKVTHPDTKSGSPEEFKSVQSAYELLKN